MPCVYLRERVLGEEDGRGVAAILLGADEVLVAELWPWHGYIH